LLLIVGCATLPMYPPGVERDPMCDVCVPGDPCERTVSIACSSYHTWAWCDRILDEDGAMHEVWFEAKYGSMTFEKCPETDFYVVLPGNPYDHSD
jgi:hypothetical protein